MEEKENNLNNNNKTNSLKKKKLKFKSLFSNSNKKLNNNNSDEQTTTTIESVSSVRVTTTASAPMTTNTIMTVATTTGNENNNTKINNYNKKLNKSASSSDLNNSNNNNNCTKDAIQKYSIFGTIKRNFQNKFSPNRKIINEDNFLPIPVENNDNLNNNSSSCNDINSNDSGDIVTPLERPSAEALKKTEEDEAVDKARMELTKYGWYWGSLSRTAAQRTLTGKSNGSFLVRNSETDRLQFTLSFRSANVTLHNRIYYVNGYWQIESQRYKSIVDLFEDTIRKSENCVFCYVKPVNRLLPPVPVRLTHPINRYYEVASLQHLCRFVLRSKFHLESFSNIQLPGKVRAYIEENFYENI